MGLLSSRGAARARANRSPGAHRRTGEPSKGPGQGGFRPDVEGLRGVAVAAVLLYHAGIPLVTGGYVGVDVFFVISGFLITGLLVRQLERTGTVSFARFYAGRAKRLLPSLAVVLLAVAALSWLLFSPVRREVASADTIAAGLYAINWRLALRAVDYFSPGHHSPVQHFWSLAVEEQFYLVWPVLLLLVALWCRRYGRSLRPVLTTALVTLAVASFAWNMHITDAEAGRAYFSTLTRGWELALGGILALILASGVRISRKPTVALSAAGMGAIVGASLWFDDRTLFPGVAALLPTVGAAAIIAAGTAGAGAWPQRLLSLPPVRHVGRLSYTWYLWHWPALVFAQTVWGNLSAIQGAAVVAASYVPTLLTHRFVEEPLRRSRPLSESPRRALQLGAVCTSGAVALAAVVYVTVPTIATAPQDEVQGARALDHTDSPQQRVDKIRPEPRTASEDRGTMYADGCLVRKKDTKSGSCVYGDESAEKTVVLFGDSHAMQWFPALNKVAEDRHWRLVGLTKSGCTPARVPTYSADLKREYSECETWRRHALDRIEKIDPAMVVTSSLTSYTVLKDHSRHEVLKETDRLDRKASDRALVDGYAKTLKQLRATGARVFAIHEVPHNRGQVADCVSAHPRDLGTCTISKREAFDYNPIGAKAAKRVDGVRMIDATPKLCPDGKCPGVIGDVLVYRNGGHLTATYVRTLDRWLGHELPSTL